MVAVAAVVSAVAYGVGLHRVNAASAELTRGHPQAAISPSRAAARINRLGISSLMIEAKARLQIGDQPGAVRAATRSTERQPKNPFAWECLAEVTTGTERTAALTRVAELDPRREPTEAPLCQPSW
jgi:predicted Zn-dependent protease